MLCSSGSRIRKVSTTRPTPQPGSHLFALNAPSSKRADCNLQSGRLEPRVCSSCCATPSFAIVSEFHPSKHPSWPCDLCPVLRCPFLPSSCDGGISHHPTSVVVSGCGTRYALIASDRRRDDGRSAKSRIAHGNASRAGDEQETSRRDISTILPAQAVFHEGSSISNPPLLSKQEA